MYWHKELLFTTKRLNLYGAEAHWEKFLLHL